MQVQERLKEHRLFRTHDLDEARDFVAREFCPHRLVTEDSDGKVDTTHNAVHFDALSLNYLDYGATVHITPGELQSFFLVQIPLDGSARVTNGDETVLANSRLATMPNPIRHLDMTWNAGSPHLLVHINREVLESKLEALTDCPLRAPLQFELGLDLTAPQVVAWRQFLDLMVDDAENQKLNATMRRQLEDLILVGLLTSHSHNYSHCIRTAAEPAAPRSVRRAMDTCENSPAGISTVSELAQIAGTSVRSLQEGFKAYVGLTPMEYLREVRLRKVREELIAARTDQTVSDIAQAWGFTHLGRFSQIYAQRFGESPSQTLRSRT